MAELLPCPFCGHKPELERHDDGSVILNCRTFNCVLVGCELFDWEEENMVAGWNTRVAQTSAQWGNDE